MNEETTYTVFAHDHHLGTGSLNVMLLETKAFLDTHESASVLIFEDQSGKQIDFDFRGTPDDVLARLAFHPLFASSPVQAPPQCGPGRPRLGVVCREVSMLPRHWEWLERQPGGSSAALRRLVDEARKREPKNEDIAALRDAAGRFMMVMAGNLPNFEEVTRALYSGNYDQTKPLMQEWPNDIREHSLHLVARCAQAEGQSADVTASSRVSCSSHDTQPSV